MEKEKNKVKQVRLKLEYGQQEFADELKVSKSIIAKAESGNAPISDSLVSKICNKFHVNRGFFDGTEDLILERKLTSSDPWKDEAYLNLKETAKKWEEKYEKLWAKFEILLDRVQPSQPGKFKALNLAGGQKRSQLRATA